MTDKMSYRDAAYLKHTFEELIRCNWDEVSCLLQNGFDNLHLREFYAMFAAYAASYDVNIKNVRMKNFVRICDYMSNVTSNAWKNNARIQFDFLVNVSVITNPTTQPDVFKSGNMVLLFLIKRLQLMARSLDKDFFCTIAIGFKNGRHRFYTLSIVVDYEQIMAENANTYLFEEHQLNSSFVTLLRETLDNNNNHCWIAKGVNANDDYTYASILDKKKITLRDINLTKMIIVRE